LTAPSSPTRCLNGLVLTHGVFGRFAKNIQGLSNLPACNDYYLADGFLTEAIAQGSQFLDLCSSPSGAFLDAGAAF